MVEELFPNFDFLDDFLLNCHIHTGKGTPPKCMPQGVFTCRTCPCNLYPNQESQQSPPCATLPHPPAPFWSLPLPSLRWPPSESLKVQIRFSGFVHYTNGITYPLPRVCSFFFYSRHGFLSLHRVAAFSFLCLYSTPLWTILKFTFLFHC